MVLRLERLIIWSKRYGFTIAMLVFALGVGFLSVKKPILPILMFAGMIYFILMFARPLWTYMFMILVICNFFGLINMDYLAILGKVKLHDICLFSLFPVIIGNLVVDRESIKYLKTPFNKYIFSLLTFFVFVTCYTMLRYDVSLGLTVRFAKKYLFYTSFFVVLYYVQDIDDLKKLLRFLFVLASICVLLFLTQFFLGPRIKIMRHLLVATQHLGGFSNITRVYLTGGTPLLVVSFSICFWLAQTYEEKRTKNIYLTLALLFGITLFLCFSRARWVMQFFIMFIPFWFAKNFERVNALRVTLILCCLIVILIIIGYASGNNLFSSLLTKLIPHIESTFYDALNKTGTFGYRLEDSAMRINMFLKHPWIGVGFLHHLAALESSKAAFVRNFFLETTDSGIISLIVTMGLSGVIVFAIVLTAFIVRTIRTILRIQSPLFRGIALGCLGYIASACITFITLPCFVSVNEIPFIALIFALAEKVSQLEQKKE